MYIGFLMTKLLSKLSGTDRDATFLKKQSGILTQLLAELDLVVESLEKSQAKHSNKNQELNDFLLKSCFELKYQLILAFDSHYKVLQKVLAQNQFFNNKLLDAQLSKANSLYVRLSRIQSQISK